MTEKTYWNQVCAAQLAEIEGLCQAAQADQIMIKRLRQERLAAINEADAYRGERDCLRAEIAELLKEMYA